MGGRGAISGGARGNNNSSVSFVPQRKDEITEKLNGKTLSLSANTITIKNNDGKTQGMVRNISRVSTSSPQDQMLMHQFSKKTGVDVRHFGTENIYKQGNTLYIFNNTKNDVVSAKLKNVNKQEYNKFVEKKKNLKSAEDGGAFIINYKKH